MILRKEEIIRLRELIPLKTAEVTDGRKINIDKEILEQLLFDIIHIKDTKEIVKLPVWSGTFLRKIDLSEISFDNVSWSLMSYIGQQLIDDIISNPFDDKTWEILESYARYYEHSEHINYSYTNARIDFTKSWEFKRVGTKGFSLVHCNFSGVDLSNNNMSLIHEVFDCNLSNTGIILDPSMIGDGNNKFGKSDLSNIDLSKFTINGYSLLSGEFQEIFDEKCNLANTGINILLNEEMTEFLNYLMSLSNNEIKLLEDKIVQQEKEERREILGYEKYSLIDMLTNGYINGCYINGKIISRVDLVDDIINDIDTQIDNLRRSK